MNLAQALDGVEFFVAPLLASWVFFAPTGLSRSLYSFEILLIPVTF
jgi:hypothetical protein